MRNKIVYFGTTSKQFKICYNMDASEIDFSLNQDAIFKSRFNFFKLFPGWPEIGKYPTGVHAAIDYAVNKAKEDNSIPILIEVILGEEHQIKRGLIGHYVEKPNLKLNKTYIIEIKNRLVHFLKPKISCKEIDFKEILRL